MKPEIYIPYNRRTPAQEQMWDERQPEADQGTPILVLNPTKNQLALLEQSRSRQINGYYIKHEIGTIRDTNGQ